MAGRGVWACVGLELVEGLVAGGVGVLPGLGGLLSEGLSLGVRPEVLRAAVREGVLVAGGLVL